MHSEIPQMHVPHHMNPINLPPMAEPRLLMDQVLDPASTAEPWTWISSSRPPGGVLVGMGGTDVMDVTSETLDKTCNSQKQTSLAPRNEEEEYVEVTTLRPAHFCMLFVRCLESSLIKKV